MLPPHVRSAHVGPGRAWQHVVHRVVVVCMASSFYHTGEQLDVGGRCIMVPRKDGSRPLTAMAVQGLLARELAARAPVAAGAPVFSLPNALH